MTSALVRVYDASAFDVRSWIGTPAAQVSQQGSDVLVTVTSSNLDDALKNLHHRYGRVEVDGNQFTAAEFPPAKDEPEVDIPIGDKHDNPIDDTDDLPGEADPLEGGGLSDSPSEPEAAGMDTSVTPTTTKPRGQTMAGPEAPPPPLPAPEPGEPAPQDLDPLVDPSVGDPATEPDPNVTVLPEGMPQ